MLKKLMIATLTALVVTGGVVPAANAATGTHHRPKTVELAAPTHYVALKDLKVRHFEKLARGRALVTVNDGSVWIFRPCPLEDSPRCWWDAGTSGNHMGHSFVQLGTKTMYLDRVLGVAR